VLKIINHSFIKEYRCPRSGQERRL